MPERRARTVQPETRLRDDDRHRGPDGHPEAGVDEQLETEAAERAGGIEQGCLEQVDAGVVEVRDKVDDLFPRGNHQFECCEKDQRAEETCRGYGLSPVRGVGIDLLAYCVDDECRERSNEEPGAKQYDSVLQLLVYVQEDGEAGKHPPHTHDAGKAKNSDLLVGHDPRAKAPCSRRQEPVCPVRPAGGSPSLNQPLHSGTLIVAQTWTQ